MTRNFKIVNFYAVLAGLIWLVMAGEAGAQGPPGMFIQVVPEHDLDYGTAAQNQGVIIKGATDQAIGKFEVWAQLPPNKRVRITIQPPEYFMKGSDEVPYDIKASYNAHADDPSTATEITGLTATFTPQANPTYNHPPPPFPEVSAYIYVYGTVDVGYQSSGTYSAPITLEAEMTN